MGLLSPVWRLRPFVPRDVLLLVFWWGRSQSGGFYPVEGMACSLSLLGRM